MTSAKTITTLILLAATGFSASRCSSRRDEVSRLIEQYGKKFNAERGKLGIPIIEDSWVAHDGDSSGVTWMNSSHQLTTKQAHHFAKHIAFWHGQLISEEDSFNKFLNDSTDQRVIYVYTFQTGQWTCTLSTHYYGGLPPTPERISMVQADAILTKWGLHRTHEVK